MSKPRPNPIRREKLNDGIGITLTLEADDLTRVERIAASRNVSISAVIRPYVREGLDREEGAKS